MPKKRASCENPRLDYPKVKDRKDGIVNKHANGVGHAAQAGQGRADHRIRHAEGRRQGRGEVRLRGTQTLEAKNIIIATGSEARMIPGLQPDPGVHPHQHRDSEPHGRAQEPGRSSARARSAWSSPPFSNASAPRSP